MRDATDTDCRNVERWAKVQAQKTTPKRPRAVKDSTSQRPWACEMLQALKTTTTSAVTHDGLVRGREDHLTNTTLANSRSSRQTSGLER